MKVDPFTRQLAIAAPAQVIRTTIIQRQVEQLDQFAAAACVGDQRFTQQRTAQAFKRGRKGRLSLQQWLFGHIVVDPEIVRQLFYGLVLILVMLYRPAGLWPARQEALR